MAANFTVLLDEHENICLTGSIDFNNVVLILANGIELMNAVSSVCIDLVGVNQVDSSSLALLLALVREAKSQQKKIKLRNIPPFLASLARVSGLDAVLLM